MNELLYLCSIKTQFLVSYYIIFLLEHWIAKVGVFFVCMRKFLYLCIANRVKKAFFMVL